MRLKFEFCVNLYASREVSMSFSLLRNEYNRIGTHKLDSWNEVWDYLTALIQHKTITKSQVIKSWLIKLFAKDIYVDFGS